MIIINLSIPTRMSNFIHELIACKDSCLNDPSIWTDSISTFLNINCFVYAALFHLFNWLYQVCEIRTIMTNWKSYQNNITFFLVVWIVILALIFSSLVFVSWVPISVSQTTIISLFSYVFWSAYFVMVGMFAAAWFYYIRTLQMYSFSRAQIMKPRVVLSSVLIWLPFWIRGCFLIYSSVSNFEEDFVKVSLQNNSVWLPVFLVWYYLSVDILPLGAQMISLKIVINHYYIRLDSDQICTPIQNLAMAHKNRELNSEWYRESSENSMHKSMFESKCNNENQSEDSHIIDSIATSHS